jgi:uncharacterized protein with HEPN domain
MAASKNPLVRLLHILDEIEGVAVAVRGLSFEQYRESYVHRRAIERAVQIVSEATKSVPQDILSRHSDVPWKSMISIGNILRHEYQQLDDKVLWEIATVHLPALDPIVRRMIEQLESEIGSSD